MTGRTERERMIVIWKEADTVAAALAVREMAERSGMSGGASSALATAVSELTTNVVKYARRGRLTLRVVKRVGQPGLEAVVEDAGPGIEDLETAMKEHESTGGTLGLGLPGTKRLVDEFEIDSGPGRGTRVRVVKWG
jgi:serine/threonine-protein kinase RsbT